ncbi:hypothetical protein IKT18_01060 [Candidatus Saccharibacteria bacterium]|nr:hypothetical protein [Candidatus Saccharibacteria bacterium]
MDNTNVTVPQTDTTDITSDAAAQPTATDATAPISTPVQDAPAQDDTQDDVQDDAQGDDPAQGSMSVNDLTNEEAINLFVQGIMEEKGVSEGSEEIQSAIFQDLKNKLLQELDRSLIAELPDDKIDELNKMATEEGQIDPEIIANMIEEAGLNSAEIIGVTMARFRDLYLGNISASEDDLTTSDDLESEETQIEEEVEQ